MKKSLALIDDLIAIEEQRDRAHKITALKTGKGNQSLGESQMLFHLKELKKLVEEESKNMVVIPEGATEIHL